MFNDLINENYGEDQSPIEDTNIVLVSLYFSDTEIQEFKYLCKEAMKKEWPTDYVEKGNISDLLITMLRKYYGSKNITPETSHDGHGSRAEIQSAILDEGFF